MNVSARQFDSDQILTDIQDALSASGLDPSALTIEITETTLMRNIQETAIRLAALKRIGVRIAIDDFGTGYSSLAHLQQVPVDALKIDRSFITGLAHSEEGETLIRTLVQLGKALSIETVAEGIEQQQELSLLRDEHCDSRQGFPLARPLDVAATETFLQNLCVQVTPGSPQPPQLSWRRPTAAAVYDWHRLALRRTTVTLFIAPVGRRDGTATKGCRSAIPRTDSVRLPGRPYR